MGFPQPNFHILMTFILARMLTYKMPHLKDEEVKVGHQRLYYKTLQVYRLISVGPQLLKFFSSENLTIMYLGDHLAHSSHYSILTEAPRPAKPTEYSYNSYNSFNNHNNYLLIIIYLMI